MKTTQTQKLINLSADDCLKLLSKAQNRYAQTQTETDRLDTLNKAARARVAVQNKHTPIFATTLAKHALSSKVRTQLHAATTDNYKRLQGLREITTLIDGGATKVRDAWLSTILAINSPDNYVSVNTLHNRIPRADGTGRLDKSPIRNTLSSLYILGLLTTREPHQPRYLTRIAQHEFKPADWEQYKALIVAAKQERQTRAAALMANYS